MQSTSGRDLAVGLFVVAGLAAIAYLSLAVGGLGSGPGRGLPLHAIFDQVAGLKPRAPVSLSGVKVGQVASITLADDYRARVDIEVDAALELPIDSSVSILTSGLLGDRYVSLELGAEEDFLQPGDAIAYTESALVLERLVGKFLYNVRAEGD